MNKAVCIFFFVVILVGCSSTPAPLAKLEHISSPKLNETVYAELGDTVVRYTIAATKPSWKLLTSRPIQKGASPVRAGTVLQPITSEDDYEGFWGGLCRHKTTGEWCFGMTAFGVCNALTCSTMGPEEVLAEPANYIEASSRNIDQQLIYNGKVDNNIKFTYREFTNSGLARDAFTQDVQYDLNEGAVIGFKGARLEVIEATNRQVKYRVLRHFPAQ